MQQEPAERVLVQAKPDLVGILAFLTLFLERGGCQPVLNLTLRTGDSLGSGA